jgi:hypothetical protein
VLNRRTVIIALIGLALVVVAGLYFYWFPRMRLMGIYRRSGPPSVGLQRIEITRDRFILYLPGAGPLAQEYSVADNRIYVGSQPSQLLFSIDGLGVISNQGNMGLEGTYIK